MRLSAKVTLFILSGAILSTTVVSFVTFQFTERALETVMIDNQLATTRSTMDSIDRVLEGYYRDMKRIAYTLQDSLLGSNPDNVRQVLSTTSQWKFFTLVHLDKNTTTTWYGSLNEKEQVATKHFAQKITNHESVQYSDSIFETGTIPLMLFATYMSDTDVLVGAISWDQIAAILNQLNDSSVFLFNQQQYLLASNQYELKIRAGIDRLSYPELSAAFDGTSVTSVGNNLYHNIAQYEGNNYQALLSAVPERGFQEFAGNSWVLVLERPKYLVFEAAHTQTLHLVLLVIALLLIASSISLFILRKYVTSPVGKLTKIANTIAKGAFEVRASIDAKHAKDEIGDLAKAFNTMTQKLSNAYHLLDKKFQEIATKNTKLTEYDTKLHHALVKLQKNRSLIAQAKAKVESILESIGDGVIATDAKGNIIMINSQAFHILGFAQNEVIGKPIEQAFSLLDEHGKIIPASRTPLRQALGKKKTITTAKYAYTCKNGTTLPVIITSSAMVLNGKIIGALDVFHDLTEERKLDRAKTEFVSLASHQLRMPLSIVNWYTEMLLSGDAGELTTDQKTYLEEIHLGNQRMTDLVSTLLNVSRIETGTFVPVFNSVAMDQVVKNSIAEIAPLAIKKNITLQKNISDSTIPEIQTDRELVQVLLQNLLSNAIKYTPPSGKIQVTLKKEPKYLVFEVTDTGYGIPDIEQKHIFTKLFRASNIKEKDTDGTGLGLYIVKAIVKQLRGKINFVSKVGKGTTFSVHLPYQVSITKKPHS